MKFNEFKKYYSDGQLKYKEFSLNGNLHNSNGPAIQRWHENGQLEYEAYYINGVFHNINGPAIIKYSKKTGNPSKKIYCLDGYIFNTLKDFKYSLKLSCIK